MMVREWGSSLTDKAILYNVNTEYASVKPSLVLYPRDVTKMWNGLENRLANRLAYSDLGMDF